MKISNNKKKKIIEDRISRKYLFSDSLSKSSHLHLRYIHGCYFSLVWKNLSIKNLIAWMSFKDLKSKGNANLKFFLKHCWIFCISMISRFLVMCQWNIGNATQIWKSIRKDWAKIWVNLNKLEVQIQTYFARWYNIKIIDF